MRKDKREMKELSQTELSTRLTAIDAEYKHVESERRYSTMALRIAQLEVLLVDARERLVDVTARARSGNAERFVGV